MSEAGPVSWRTRLARRGGSWLEPGLGASRWSKVLGLPRMAGRLREMAEFTTDGCLQRWAFCSGKKLIWNPGFNCDFTWRAECQDQQQWWVRRHELVGCLRGGSAQVGGRWRGADGALSKVVGGQAGRGQEQAGRGS